MPEESVGFWSYVQQDDADDFGRIVGLAQHLRGAFRLQTSSGLQLFLDRESLQWGDEWQARIDNAIAGTTFFIPVITPSYFRSTACRRELLKFSREATRLGLEQLIMPIYWVSVPELELAPEDISDEAVAAIARYQWQDFRDVRLEEESSSAFRRTVHKLAEELSRRATDVINSVDDIPRVSVPVGPVSLDPHAEDDEAPGILEKLVVTEEAFPRLTEILQEMTEALETVGKLGAKAGEKAEADAARGGGVKSRLLITERFAHELAPPAANIERLGHQYASLLMDTDPGVLALLEVAAESDPDEDRDGFLQVIESLQVAADDTLEMFSDLMETIRGVARLSRSLRAPLSQMGRGVQAVLDGRDIIAEWGRRAAEISAAVPSETDGDPDAPVAAY
jgi:hypothetical protein